VPLHGELLERQDREIRTTQHVAEALTLAKQPFDLLISDINLGTQQNGMDVLRVFKQANARGHVVLISGFNSTADRDRCGPRGRVRLHQRRSTSRKSRRPWNGRCRTSAFRWLHARRSTCRRRPHRPDCRHAVGLQADRTCGERGAPVLIIGDSGTGKELVARHSRPWPPAAARSCRSLRRSHGKRSNRALRPHARVVVGAIADTKGIFEQATGGTVFWMKLERPPPRSR
jgi:DNA-binding NtrC family response regulator